MTRLRRVRDKALIPADFRDPKRIDKAMTLLVAAGSKRVFDSGYWKRAKKQLKAETDGKCAYCEAPTATVAHGAVEHFRPKDYYWWLAYCYDNYLFACQVCNETYKGNAFPLAGEKTPMSPKPFAGRSRAAKRAYVASLAPDPLDDLSLKKFERDCLAEGSLLLNPYFDDPDEHLTWEADTVTRKVWVRPKGKASIPHHRAAETYYGLNRDELLVERWRFYRNLETFKNAYQDCRIRGTSLHDEIADQLREMIDPRAPFAGMCRYFVKQKWKLPI
jgi:hypothetical protein